jgi:hypothetical protein
MEQEDAKHPPLLAQPGSLPPAFGLALDVVSKSVAAFAIVLYGCGFLITSIHQFNYGFTESSPLRPRIASAGAWFIVFVVIPIVFEIEHRKLTGRTENHQKWLRRFSTIIFFDCAVSMFFGSAFWMVFDSQTDYGASNSIFAAGTAILALVVVGVLVFLDQWERFPRVVAPIASLALVGFLSAYGMREAFTYHRATAGAIMLWFLYAGILFNRRNPLNREAWSRPWKLWEDGNWPQQISFAIIGLLAFASLYYPHIKSSWGGGAPIPVTIYFTKDSTIMPSQNVGALLVDESDAGLYVVGKNDKKATFIPRSAVGLVYYSDDISGFSLAKPK